MAEKTFQFRRQLVRNQRVIAAPGDEVTAEELGKAMFDVLEAQGLGIVSESSSSDENEAEATSAAEELANEENLDLSDIEGTGKNGKVTKGDVEDALNE